MLTTDAMRSKLPEFADLEKYPDGMVAFWITFCARLVDPERVGDATDDMVALAVAHSISLAAHRVAVASGGGLPGAVVATLTSKTVDSVSASYDTAGVTLADAGHWNQTQYGIMFWNSVQTYGAGCIQI